MDNDKEKKTIPVDYKDNKEEIKNGDNYNVPTNYRDLKEASNNYEDYKYVYTGYVDYCKKHDIKLEEETTLNDEDNDNKEIIDHDHRFAFDFDNPNQHEHDYSFEFDNNKNKQVKDTASNNYGYYYNNNSNNNSNNNNLDNGIANFNKRATNQFTCIMWIVIALFIFVPLISSLISEFISAYNEYDNSNDDYEYEYYDDENEYDDYEDLIDSFVLAVDENDINYIYYDILEYDEEVVESFEEYISFLHTQTYAFYTYDYQILKTIDDFDLYSYDYISDYIIFDYMEIQITFYKYSGNVVADIEMVKLDEDSWYLVKWTL